MKHNLILICPVCKSKLAAYDKHYKCQKNHTFDVAKEKYVNLILNNSQSSGDDKAMILSRHTFLEKGYYIEVSNQLNQIVKSFIKNEDDDFNIIDAGCGEGYYLNQLYVSLKDYEDVAYYGFDISKKGVQLSAKRNTDITWFVGNSFNLPIENKSINCFISMFSFYSVSEIDRVLKDDGKAVIFRAGRTHLLELKSILYDELSLKDSNIEEEFKEGFIIKKQNFKHIIHIDTYEDLERLLHMTPHYWKTKEENKERLKNYDSLECTLDIDMYIIEKNNF